MTILKEYGPAIGPALAFLLGVITLLVKQALDNAAARRNAERRLQKIIALVVLSPPPSFQRATEESERINHIVANMVNFSNFYNRMVAIKGAFDAAEKPLHEQGRLETILRFEAMRIHFDSILRERQFFRKPERGDPIPDYDNFANAEAFLSRRSPLLLPAHRGRSRDPLPARLRRVSVERRPHTRRAFERIFREYGLPRAILSDNGSPFGSPGLARLSRLSLWWI